MNIKMERKNNELTVTLEGRLDTLSSPELEEQLEPAMEGIEKLIFDMTELEYISSAGLRVLLSALKIMEEQGTMVVRGVNPVVMEVFEITGFVDVLNIE